MADINQYVLYQRIEQLLNRLGEAPPSWAVKGLCSAYVLLLFRSQIINEQDKFFDRLHSLTKLSEDDLKLAGDLLRQYTERFKKLSANKKFQLEEKLQAASKDKIVQTKIRKEHYDAISTELLKIYNKKQTKLIDQANDLYQFFNSLLFAFFPGRDFGLLSNDHRVEQHDIIEVLKILPPDILISKDENKTVNIPIKKAYSFQFSFTHHDLTTTFEKLILENDLIRISSTDHAMYIKRQNGKYILYDPNEKSDPKEFTTCSELEIEVSNNFYTDFKKSSDVMPISIDIYENSNITQVRPTQLLDDIFQQRKENNIVKDINAQGWDGATALYLAISKKNTALVKQLIEKKANIELPATNKENQAIYPIDVAMQNGAEEIVELLILAKTDVNKERDGTNLLWSAACKGSTPVVKKLIKHKAELNTVNKTDNHTPLTAALANGYPETAKAIIEAIPNIEINAINTQIKTGQTPLWLAAQHGFSDIVQTLIDRKADLNSPSKPKNYTPLMIAINNGHKETAKKLIEAKADLKIQLTEDKMKNALYIAFDTKQFDIAELLMTTDADLANQERIFYTAAANGNMDLVKKLVESKTPLEPLSRLVPLHNAIANKHIQIAAYLLENKASTYCQNENNYTAMMVATETKQSDMVRLLLKNKASPHTNSWPIKFSPIVMALKKRDLESIQLLIEAKAYLNEKDDKYNTLLNLAIQNGHEEAVDLLLKAKADIKDNSNYLTLALEKGYETLAIKLFKSGAKESTSFQDSHHFSPFHIAAMQGLSQFINTLLESKVDINTPTQHLSYPPKVKTALLIALEHGQLDLANELIEKKANVHAVGDKGSTMELATDKGYHSLIRKLHKEFKMDLPPKLLDIAINNLDEDTANLLLDLNIHSNTKNSNSNTPLDLAIKTSQMNLVNRLINMKANPNNLDSQGMTPLHHAIESENKEAVELLLKQKAEPTLCRNNFNALETAAKKGNCEIIKKLFEFKALIYIPNRFETPLNIAIAYHKLDAVKLLIENKANPNLINQDGKNALMYAAGYGLNQLITEFIEQKVDINAKSSTEFNALKIAIMTAHTSTVELLLNANADFLTKDTNGKTLLHYAIADLPADSINAAPIVTMLIEKKIDINAISSENESALSLAIEYKKPNLARLLIQSKANLDIKNSDENTPVIQAIYNNNPEILKELLEAKASLNIKLKTRSPLYAAISEDNLNIVEILIAYKADINEKSGRFHLSPLKEAILRKKFPIAKKLLELKADAKLTDDENEDALHLAFEKPDIELIELLIKANCSLTQKGGFTKKNSLQQALMSNNENLIKVVLSHYKGSIPELIITDEHITWLRQQLDALVVLTETQNPTYTNKAKTLKEDIIRILEYSQVNNISKFFQATHLLEEALNENVDSHKESKSISFHSLESPYTNPYICAVYQLLKNIESNIFSISLTFPPGDFQTIADFPKPAPIRQRP